MAALFHFRTSSTNPLPARKAATTGIIHVKTPLPEAFPAPSGRPISEVI
ncbi:MULTISPECIES: hypothetical protein [Geobacter]|nr:hypothetical protein [Geobacter sulfurreducens]BEH09724.1 hypothetical protein GSUET_13360 [Geobacter sulfurreducens subsp. ethanolicus]HML78846.1 hypothetical protein [Geobacter sulfurreducens]